MTVLTDRRWTELLRTRAEQLQLIVEAYPARRRPFGNDGEAGYTGAPQDSRTGAERAW